MEHDVGDKVYSFKEGIVVAVYDRMEDGCLFPVSNW